MVYRIYVEKKKELAHEANGLLKDINGLLQINSVKNVRVPRTNKNEKWISFVSIK